MESTSFRLPTLSGREDKTDCQTVENATCICNTQGKYDKKLAPKRWLYRNQSNGLWQNRVSEKPKSAGTNSDEVWIPPRIDRWFKVGQQASLQNHTLLFHTPPKIQNILNEPEIQVTHPLTYWWTIFPPTLSQSQIQSQQGRSPKALYHSLGRVTKECSSAQFLLQVLLER